jgi:hypothetical protein
VKAIVVALALTSVASADPAPSAEDVRGAPRPGDESGRSDEPEGDGALRTVGRGLLWIPRLPLEAVAQPVRGLLYVQDRYLVAGAVISLFATDDLKIAVFPTALFETGFGLDVGVRAFFKDLLIDGSRLDLRAAFGGEDQWLAHAGLKLDRHRGAVAASLEGQVARRDSEVFYGIGDLTAPPTIPYRLEVARAIARLDVRLPSHLTLRGTGAVVSKELAEASMTEVPGFERIDFSYGELELAWDTRRRADRTDMHGARGTGSLLLAFGGRARGIADDVAFSRVGFDLQHYIRIARGPRTLELRAYVDAIAGDQVPFSELPRLGGPSLLRGYPSDRFRDRIAVVTQASYLWSAASWLAPVLFVDCGRVFPDLAALSFDQPRVGFGAGLEVYSRGGLAMRFELASSIDGGLFAYWALNPAYDARARVERN